MAERVEGPTPNGGAYAVALWFDVTGTELAKGSDPGVAFGQITEFDDSDLPLYRTYTGSLIDGPSTNPAPFGPSTPASDAHDPWQNMHGGFEWDVWLNGKKVQTLSELIQSLQLESTESARGWALTAMELPVWLAMPASLRSELVSLVTST